MDDRRGTKRPSNEERIARLQKNARLGKGKEGATAVPPSGGAVSTAAPAKTAAPLWRRPADRRAARRCARTGRERNGQGRNGPGRTGQGRTANRAAMRFAQAVPGRTGQPFIHPRHAAAGMRRGLATYLSRPGSQVRSPRLCASSSPGPRQPRRTPTGWRTR
ncbi:hypothetical protein TIFTF001_038261 [Ficus carica]|uniref:Uncharacterized protein n=1 Tax=Ficus carica TaxID=3494 RepID=A0AA88E7S7_FICCA|nr:hypothetical protein TIFTF001_038261 [Ficus carica]